jgi:hypothetical protein
LKIARLLEPAGMLWIHQAIVQKQGTGFTWAMLERVASARPPKN